MNLHDTIVALATPAGKSGVAVIRISGAQTKGALDALGCGKLTPRMAHLRSLQHAGTGQRFDKALVIFFPAPHSFTGEDVGELHVHGSMAVIRSLLQFLCALPGLRQAEPGEFSMRAFHHQKMDLTQLEGLADLIDAQTSLQHRQALRLMDGQLGGHYEQWRIQLVQALARLEAYIDFPDEELPNSLRTEIIERLSTLTSALHKHLSNAQGRRIREGLLCVIAGAPNAGKSSLLNRLAQRDVAIVSSIPGTTRDALEVHMELGGMAITWCDTAGLRQSKDVIEQEGVRRAQHKLQQADIRIFLLDATAPDWPEQLPAHLDEDTYILWNKTDLAPAPAKLPAFSSAIKHPPAQNIFAVSAVTGQGVDAFLSALQEKLIARFSDSEQPAFTRDRHQQSLESCMKSCEEAARQLAQDAPVELCCESLRAAAAELGRITGRIDVEDLLDVIFSQFCIGK